MSKLIAYCSKEAHSSVEKAAMIGMVKLRILETDSKFRLRGDALQAAITVGFRVFYKGDFMVLDNLGIGLYLLLSLFFKQLYIPGGPSFGVDSILCVHHSWDYFCLFIRHAV